MRGIRRYWGCAVVLGLLALAYWLRVASAGLGGQLRVLRDTLRVTIHVGLIAVWARSLRRRVVHERLRAQLTALAALIVFWLLVKYLKYLLVLPPHADTCLWYMYYVPIVFIPLVALFASLTARKGAAYRLPAAVYLLAVPAGALATLVLTNNLHHLAFAFDGQPSSMNGFYTHGPVFYLVVAWCAACIGAFVVLLFRKTRFLALRQRLPFVLWCALMAWYTVAYVGAPGYQLVQRYLRDMTVVFCLMAVTLIELCLQNHLIPNNAGYERLFRTGRLQAAIYDDEGRLVACSDDYRYPGDEALLQCASRPVIADDHLRTSSAAIPGGRVVWQDDVSAFMETIQALEDIKLELEDENALARRSRSCPRCWINTTAPQTRTPAGRCWAAWWSSAPTSSGAATSFCSRRAAARCPAPSWRCAFASRSPRWKRWACSPISTQSSQVLCPTTAPWNCMTFSSRRSSAPCPALARLPCTFKAPGTAFAL